MPHLASARVQGEQISACVLTFNHVHLIESTLTTLLDQTIDGYEIVVSDDCSDDGTWELLKALAVADSRIRLIRTPFNMGMAGNANYAVANTHRPYIALLHHDDLYRQDLLEKWLNILDKYENAAYVFNPYDVPNAQYHYGPRFETGLINGVKFLENHLLKRWGCPVRGTAMIRRTCWNKVNGMRTEFGLLSDVDLWMRLARNFDVGYVNETIIHPRHDRPDYYPDIYTGKRWHWERYTLRMKIHAKNRAEYYIQNSLLGFLKWIHFRIRLNLQTVKWLTYALVKRKWRMISLADESKTEYDYWFLDFYRFALCFFVKKLIKVI